MEDWIKKNEHTLCVLLALFIAVPMSYYCLSMPGEFRSAIYPKINAYDWKMLRITDEYQEIKTLLLKHEHIYNDGRAYVPGKKGFGKVPRRFETLRERILSLQKKPRNP